MVGKRPPTLRAQWLGQQLRDLREAASLTLKETGDYLQRDQSAVSRMESGVYPAKVPEVLAYVNLCGVDSARRREALVQLAQDAWQTGWWDGYAEDVAAWLVDRIWLESRAAEIQAFQLAVLPGLLQTREYAECVIRTAGPEAEEDQIERWIEFRMNRQQILTGEDPTVLTVVLEEAVLRRAIGGPQVMRSQLERLAQMADWSNVEIQVLRSRTGAHASPDGGFEIFTMSEPYADVGYVETPAGAICVETNRAEELAQTYARLRKTALEPGESAELISAAAQEVE